METLYHTKQGMTLIEILVVIAILTIIISFGMMVDLNAFKGDTFLAEQSKIVSALERARSHAMANMFQSAFTVCYVSPNYVISYDGNCNGLGTDELIPANTNIATASGFPFPTVVFNQLTGNVTVPPPSIIITDGIKSLPITINNEGTINW